MFFPTMERTKDRRGMPSRNTSPAAVFLGGVPPVPHYESGPLWTFGHFRRPKLLPCILLFPAHRDLLPSKFVSACSLPYTRLLLPFLLGAAGGGRTSCHSFTRVGGVRTTQTRSNFIPGRGLCPRGKKHSPSWFYPPDETTQKTGGRPP